MPVRKAGVQDLIPAPVWRVFFGRFERVHDGETCQRVFHRQQPGGVD